MWRKEFLLKRILFLENPEDSYLCFRLPLLHRVFYFFFPYRSPSLSLCTVFDSISSNIDKVLSINLSANMLVFGDFNVWRVYSNGNFPTRIADNDFHSFVLLILFISSCSSILIMLLSQFPLTLHQIHDGIPILMLIGMVFVIIWEIFHGRIYLNFALLLLLNFVRWFRLELMYLSLIISIRSSNGSSQVKSIQVSPLWFPAACPTAIIHRNLFSVSTNRINPLNLK